MGRGVRVGIIGTGWVGASVLTVSRVQSHAAGFGGVALSLPTVVGADGATTVITPELSDDEQTHLDRSAGVLRAALAGVRADAPS